MNSSEIVVAKKYAQAFLNLYIEKISYSDYCSLKAAARSLKNNGAFFSLLNIPTIALIQKRSSLYAILKELQVPEVLNTVIELIIQHQRIFLIPALLNALVRGYEERKKIISFTISSSHALPTNNLELLKKFLTKKTNAHIIYRYEINKKLIAGIRMQSDLFLWEYSVAKQLKTISKCIR